MNDKSILYFDSGVGGLPYLDAARTALPYEHFLYVGDRLHYPYGQKSSDEIRDGVVQSVGLILERFPVKAAVIACNTASVVALQTLRQTFSIPFVGVVPAVKPAAGLTKNNRIGVLATPQTVKNDYLTGLINNFADGCQVFRIPAPDLRDLVEYHFFTVTPEAKKRIIGNVVREIQKTDVDTVVIACTHFVFTINEIMHGMGENIHVIDSREGVTNQLIRVLNQHTIQRLKREIWMQESPTPFFLTGPESIETRYLHFAEMFHCAAVKSLF